MVFRLVSLSVRRAVHARKQGRTLNQFPPYQTLAIIWTGPLSFLRTHGPVRNVKRARTASGTRAGRLGALRTFVLGHHNCAFSLANFGQLAWIRPIFINLRGNYFVHLSCSCKTPKNDHWAWSNAPSIAAAVSRQRNRGNGKSQG
jgi:hypothetical protein